MAMLADVHFKVEPKVKKQSEIYLKSMGITLSDYLNMSLRQLNNKQKIPFEVEVPMEEIYREIDEKIAAEKPENLPENMRPKTEEEMEEYLKGVLEDEKKNPKRYTQEEIEKIFGVGSLGELHG